VDAVIEREAMKSSAFAGAMPLTLSAMSAAASTFTSLPSGFLRVTAFDGPEASFAPHGADVHLGAAEGPPDSICAIGAG
jgi:hypothetical protein